MTTDTPMDPSAEESMADDWARPALVEATRQIGALALQLPVEPGV